MKTEEKSQVIAAMQSPERFRAMEDGWIKDSFLGLEWGPSSEKYLTFKQAQKYCKDQGGRLPEIHELHSLVDFTREEPAINPIFKDTISSYYWSATVTKWNKTARWCVGFYRGSVSSGGEGYSSYARPVRVSQ